MRPWSGWLERVRGGPRKSAAPRGARDSSLDDYPEWLRRRIAERADGSPAGADPGLLSLVTCLYDGSPPGLFAETRDCVLGQSDRDLEWIVLANGALPAALGEVVGTAAEDQRVRLLSRPENLGIMRGLRVCLEAAAGEYVLPLDGDDLLTPDAVGVLRCALAINGSPALLYGDEDAWVDGEPRHPYFRPDWDPVLNLTSSYIWHPSVFRRDLALDLGVFTDVESEYCQDWDTVFRFVRAGYEPVHVPEILYHWRAHEGSSTHRPDRVRGSLDSQRHVLEEELRARPDSGSFEIVESPLDRGLPEWWVRRRRDQEPQVATILVDYADDAAETTDDAGPLLEGLDADLLGRHPSTLHLADLSARVDASDADVVLFIDASLSPLGDAWAWEAFGLLDLFPRLVAVGGRVVDPSGTVRTGELLVAPGARLACPDEGREHADPGYYAFSLKPHLTDAVSGRLVFVRRAWLAESLARLPEPATLSLLGGWLGVLAAAGDRQIAYSPIITATCPAGHACTETCTADERAAFATAWGGEAASGRWETRLRAADLGERRPLAAPHTL